MIDPICLKGICFSKTNNITVASLQPNFLNSYFKIQQHVLGVPLDHFHTSKFKEFLEIGSRVPTNQHFRTLLGPICCKQEFLWKNQQ